MHRDRVDEIDIVTALSGLGSRKTGSAGNSQARDMIIEAMSAVGDKRFELILERFEVPVCQDRPAAVEGAGQAFEARAIDYTGIERNEARGEMLYLAGGEPWRYWLRRVRGRIIVCDFHLLNHRIMQIKRAARNGAAGLILVSGHKDDLQAGTGAPADTPGAGMPVVVIRRKDWTALRKASTRQATVRMQSALSRKEGVNLIFDLPGRERDKTIVIGAHYDSWFHGAQDNASGVAVLVAMAQELAEKKLRHNLRFIFFDAEELGMVGSRRHLAQQSGDYRFFLNLDMPLPVKGSRLMVMFTSGHFRAWSRLPLGSMVSAGYCPWPLPLHVFYAVKDMCFPSDVHAFYRKGIPCATSFCSGPDYHTVSDAPGLIRKEAVLSITRMFCDYVSAVDRY